MAIRQGTLEPSLEQRDMLAMAKAKLRRSFKKALLFFKKLLGIEKEDELTVDAMKSMVDKWQTMTNLANNWSMAQLGLADEDVDTETTQIIDALGLQEDPSNWGIDQKRNFVNTRIQEFLLRTTTEVLHKQQWGFVKGCLSDLTYDATQTSFTIDTSQAQATTKAAAIAEGVMRIVMTSESGLSRMLSTPTKDYPNGRSVIVLFMGDTERDTDAQANLEHLKHNVFKYGFTDVRTGKHYQFAFQNPSSTRKANFMFVEARDFEDVKSLWVKVTGFKSWDDLVKHSGLFDKNGCCVYSKFLARISSRGSSCFSVQQIAEQSGSKRLQEIAEKVRKWNVLYTPDCKWTVKRTYRKMVGPGKMETEEGGHKVTPGDGSGYAKLTSLADLTVLVRRMTIDEYDEFNLLWSKCSQTYAMEGLDEGEAKRLGTLIGKIVKTWQIRQISKKGMFVWGAYDEIDGLKEYDLIVPESVRKYMDGDWSHMPLEICNWGKQREKYVTLNAQFLGALDLTPKAENGIIKYPVQPILDYWLRTMDEAVSNPEKAISYLGIIADSLDEDDKIEDEETLWKVGIVKAALKVNPELIYDKQIRIWLQSMFQKRVDDMSIGRITVPGSYTYMVIDPYFYLNRIFYDPENAELREKWWPDKDERQRLELEAPLPELASGTCFYNNHSCKIAAFRSPLIHASEPQLMQGIDATKLPVSSFHLLFYLTHMPNVLIFNGYDGNWENMGGGDFDGDCCAVVVYDSLLGTVPAGKIICDAVRHDVMDVWEPGLKANAEAFGEEQLCNYLAAHAKVDRTGLITNHATRSTDIANHLKALKVIAMSQGCTGVYLFDPATLEQNDTVGQGFCGSKYTYSIAEINGERIIIARGISEYSRMHWANNGEHLDCGTYTIDGLDEIINKYEGYVEILRLLQGREIDGAKTGVYAEGESGEDFVDSVKVIYTPHTMNARTRVLKRLVSDTSQANEFHSLSPLGFINDYVTIATTAVEDGGQGMVLPKLRDGANLSLQAVNSLSAQERAAFNVMYLQDGKFQSLTEIIDARREAYGTKIHNMLNISGITEEEISGLLQTYKEEEQLELLRLAKELNISATTIAVACYNSAYSKSSKQNSGLTYGWILPTYLLEVFSRTRQHRLIDLHISQAMADSVDVKIMGGKLYVNGKQRDDVDVRTAEDDDSVELHLINGRVCGWIRTGKSNANSPDALPTTACCLRTAGLQYHIGRELLEAKQKANPGTKVKFTPEEIQAMKTAWWEKIKPTYANGFFYLDINVNATGQTVISVNGESLSAIMLNNPAESIKMAPFLGKKVYIIDPTVIDYGKPESQSITNLWVQAIGDATPLA